MERKIRRGVELRKKREVGDKKLDKQDYSPKWTNKLIFRTTKFRFLFLYSRFLFVTSDTN